MMRYPGVQQHNSGNKGCIYFIIFKVARCDYKHGIETPHFDEILTCISAGHIIDESGVAGDVHGCM